MIEGSLGVKLSTIFDRWKAETGRAREKRRVEERRSEKRKSQKVGKPRNTLFFQWFVAPEGGKVGSLKRRARSHLAKWKMKNCTPLWREAHFEVKMYKTPQLRLTFKSWTVEKVHAVVAPSTFRSQNVQKTPLSDHFWEMSKKCTPLWREAHFQVKMHKTPLSDHFWKLRCRKSARRCGTKHISKWKCETHQGFGPLLEVQMLFRVAGARECAPCQKWENVKVL